MNGSEEKKGNRLNPFQVAVGVLGLAGAISEGLVIVDHHLKFLNLPTDTAETMFIGGGTTLLIAMAVLGVDTLLKLNITQQK